MVFAGYLVRYPLGGHVQAELSCLLGLQEIGCEVWFVEAAGEEWTPCYDPATGSMTRDPSTGLEIVREEMERFGLADRWCYIDGDGAFHGFSAAKLNEICREAAFLVSRAGCTWREEFFEIPKRLYLDVDPAFTQMKLPPRGTASCPGYASVWDFTDHFTLAANIGHPECAIPLRELDWQPTWPFFVEALYEGIEAIEGKESKPGSCFSTVMSWDAYGETTWEGVTYGQKKMEFPLIENLPRQAGPIFEIALAGGDAAARAHLTDIGWSLVDANAATRTRRGYLEFLARSRGEFSVAKNGYVRSRSGWFSDRTLAYLALGRPAIIQDTGLAGHLPLGEGLLTFTTAEEAAAAIEEVQARYAFNARRARELAHEFFSAKVLARQFLQRAGLEALLPSSP